MSSAETRRRYRQANREKINALSRQWNKDNPERAKEVRRKSKLKRVFGMTVEDYDTLLETQQGVCKLCSVAPTPTKRLAVDHCHETGRVRGLLCPVCNLSLIGIIEAKGINPMSIVDYLKG